MELPKESVVAGGVVNVLLLEANKPAPVAHFLDKRVLVINDRGWWLAVVGIPLDTKAGRYDLKVKTAKKPMKFRITVKPKKYPEQHLTIKNKRMVNPNPVDLAKIKADRVILSKALSTWSKQAIIDFSFKPPVEGRLSSRFGLRRFFNKQEKNPHSGLDIAAPTGTKIKAPATAKVINTGSYYYSGNAVFLDHGQGLITGYFHLNKINVKIGDMVKQGDILGTVGSTGRVTGPHLHWNVYLNGTKVDPALFIAKDIPRLAAKNKKKKSKK
ncbi:MAG: peptidoglycan DD-metalloendopeptidase family protein [Methylococcaceae bacterium]|nr:peptidoglycan DD-metalloendopeptidase family protein [Methylococcaceae bacterium]